MIEWLLRLVFRRRGRCSGRMLPCDQTVQCFDCHRVAWREDTEPFFRDHPGPWTLVDEDGKEIA